jgi:hypothetical protein
MKQMSEFVSKLEGYADLEVSIIRVTKINKVLKAILKLNTIPKEEEFHFKPRSQSLLDKWNKLLASEQGTPGVSANTNGVCESEETKAAPTGTNGSKEPSAEEKIEDKVSVEASVPESTEALKVEDVPAPSLDEPAKVTHSYRTLFLNNPNHSSRKNLLSRVQLSLPHKILLWCNFLAIAINCLSPVHALSPLTQPKMIN